MKLTVLIDGSIYADSLCRYAAWIAARCGATIELVHVIPPEASHDTRTNMSGSIGLGARSQLLEELTTLDQQQAKLAQRRGRALVDAAEKLILEIDSKIKITERLRYGDLLETAAELEETADLIMIGKRGEGADMAKLHLGSNLERLVRASHKPMFVACRAFQPIEHMLIAFDGGASSQKAVDHLAKSRVFSGQTCTLLSVGQSEPDRFAEAQAQLADAGYTVKAELKSGKSEEVIGRAVVDLEADLLVMGAYGHSRIRNLIIGSTTTQMIRECKIPLLLFR